MPAGDGKFIHLTLCKIECLLRLPYAGGRLEGYPEHDRIAVGDAAVHSAGPVLGRMHAEMQADIAAFDIVERVIVLRTLHSGRLESISEFYATDSRDGEDGVGNQGLDRVEKRLAKAYRKAGGGALDHAAERVSRCGGFLEHFVPALLVRAASYADQFGFYVNPFEHLFGYHACGDYRKRYASGKMSAPSRVVCPVPFHCGHIVGVARTRHRIKLRIV